MNTPDFETRLKQAVTFAAPTDSVADDVMRQLPATPPHPASRWVGRRLILTAGAALTGIAAIIAFAVMLAGPSARFALADVQSAVARQMWIHIHYDGGQVKEIWENLQTGESFFTRYDGSVGSTDQQANIRLWHWKDSDRIDQDTPTIYAAGESPPKWTPQSAWNEFVVPLANAAATTQPTNPTYATVGRTTDLINGKPMVRFDEYGVDSLDKRFLYRQLWADPATHLPVRVKTYLQLGERDKSHREWSTGDYDFPSSGPRDIYALGVSRDLPIHKAVTTAPADVEPILRAINRNCDQFLKSYRAIVYTVNDVMGIQNVDIIWRSNEKIRSNRYLPDSETIIRGDEHPTTASTQPADAFEWAMKHSIAGQELMDSTHDYNWFAPTAQGAKPLMHVIAYVNFTSRPGESGPEGIQWPTRYDGQDFLIIPPNPETPPGCLGIRWGGDGEIRSDYYVDPNQDYVCVKQIERTKRSGQWIKQSQITLRDFHRVLGRTAARYRDVKTFADRQIDDFTQTTRIEVTPMSADHFPAGIFDPQSLMRGADVVGY